MAILPIPADRKEWLQRRRKYVGASEVSALLGYQASYQASPLTLYLIKAGKIQEPDFDSSRMEDGRDFEPSVARRVARVEGWTISPGVFAIDDTIGGSSATLDFVVTDTKPDDEVAGLGPGAAEIKFIQGDQRHHWADGEPPAWTLIQVQDQLACTGYKWGAVGAWIGGDYFCRRYLRQEFLISQIRKAKVEFWASVHEGRMPSADQYESTAAALKSLFPRPEPGSVVDLRSNNELPDLCISDARLQKEEARIKLERDKIKNRLRELIGPNEKALIASGITVKRTVGANKEPRPAAPGEIIPGRKGNDTLYISVPKELIEA